jgi:apolipoprotein N-acyltransferase
MSSDNASPPSWFDKPFIRYSASGLSGLLLCVCFPSVNWTTLVWVACLPLLLALLAEKRAAQGFWLGYFSGVIFLIGSCYWFVGVMRHYGGLSPEVGAGVLVLFAAVFSTFFGAFGLLETTIAKRSVGWALILAPFLWVALELARTYLITGFPWNLLGYAVRPQGLEQIARVTAVYGLSFLAVATSAVLAWIMLNPRRRFRWISLSAWVVLLAAGNGLLQPPPPQPGPNVALLVQPNIPLDEARLQDWVPWLNPNPLNTLVDRSVTASRGPAVAAKFPPLLVWPEEPAPFYFNRDPIFKTAVEQMARESNAYVIVGTVTFQGEGTSHPKNSAVVLSPDNRVLLQYDKIHLVPFGEYVPWWAFPGEVGRITSEVGVFVPGNSIRVAKTPEGSIGIFICYEAIFPQLVRKVTAAGAGVLVNISDDGWFGDSSAPYQHFEMARFRAIENGRFLLRATNNGITAIVDPYGRVQDEIPRHREMILTGSFRYLTGETFYTGHGDVFAWGCIVVALGIVLTIGLFARRVSIP